MSATEVAEKATRTATSYVVLQLQENGSYVAVQTVEAANDKAAVSSLVGQHRIDQGTFVAVPARSWRPRRIKTQTHTRVSID